MSHGERKQMLVTGATGGVGRRLVYLARAADWDVIGVYLANHDQAEALRREDAADGELQLHACDLCDSEQVDRLLRQFPETYCPAAFIHLAAPSLEIRGIQQTRWEHCQRELEGMLKPAVLLTRTLLPRMLKQKRGRIVGVLSAAVVGAPPRGFAAYATAKHALAGYFQCLAAECAGRGVIVNTVSPGPMHTGLLANLPELLLDQLRVATPGERWIDPESVARTLLWLAADAPAELHGCNLNLSAGMVL